MKLTSPMFSLDASGTIAKAITFSKWKGINYARRYVIPTYSDAMTQLKLRDLVRKASIAWESNSVIGSVTINAAYKSAFDVAASGQRYSGFNLFIKVCIAKNRGVMFNGTLVLPTGPTDVIPTSGVQTQEVYEQSIKNDQIHFTKDSVIPGIQKSLTKLNIKSLY